jgi:hypothetical protein
MILPPMLARLRIGSVSIWLPLFLLWPLVLLLAVPLFVVGMLVLPFLRGPAPLEAVRFCGGLYAVLCGLRGTSVSVDAPTAHFAFTLY